MKDLYLHGEEKFGFFTSRLYKLSGMSKTIRDFYEFVLRDINKREFKSILDIGSGTGKILNSITTSKRDIVALGIDPSPHMLGVARKYPGKEGNHARFEMGSSRNIPGDQKFDLIISTMSFHHWKDRETSIKNIMARLTPNGSFVIYEATPDGTMIRRMTRAHLMSRKDFEELATKSGLIPRIMEDSGYISCEFSLNNVVDSGS